MYKYYLGFDSLRLKSSFSYVTKKALTDYLDREGLTYTFSLDDEFEIAVFPSAADFFANYAQMKILKKQSYILACNDFADFALHKDSQGNKFVGLSLDAINYYPKADKLLLTLPSQAAFLKKHYIKTPCEIFHSFVSYPELTNVPECEKNAFRYFYRIPKEKEVVVSYGSFTDRNTVYNLNSCALINPGKEFLFFGYGDPKAMKKGFWEGFMTPKNVTLIPYLPAELYRSFLISADRLLLLGDYLSNPQIILDCLYHEIPVFSFKMNDGYPELVNSDTATLCNNFGQLFHALNSPKDNEKIKQAHAYALRLLNNLKK